MKNYCSVSKRILKIGVLIEELW